MITERIELQDDVSRPAGVAAKAVEKLVAALGRLGSVEVDAGLAGQLRVVESASARLVGSKKALGEGEREIVRQMREEARLAAKLANFDEKREKSLHAMRSDLRARQQAARGKAPGDLGPALPRTLVPTLGGMATIAGGFILAKAAQVATEIASRIAQAFVDGARMAFEAATFRQSTERGLAVILRSATKAKEVYDQGIRLAAELGTGAKETLSGLQSLISRGFPVDDAVAFTKAMADLQVVNPAANVESLIYNIAKIKGQGKVQGDELNALAEAGLNLGTIFEMVAKQTGQTVPEIQKMLAAGKLTADMALPAILASVEALTGKPLGQTAKEASMSLGGLAKRLQNVGELTLLSADFSKASDRLTAFGSSLMALIGPGTRTGTAVTKAIEDLAGALTGLLGGQDGAEKTAAAIEKMAAFGTGAAEGIKQIDWALGKLNGTTSGLDTATIEKIGTVVVWVSAAVVGAVAVIGAGVYAMVAPFVMVYQSIVGWWGDIKAFFATATGEAQAGGASIGSALVSGLVAALTGGLSLVVGAAADLAMGAVTGARGPKGADAHSPSRKTIELGEDMAAGLPVGMSRQLASVRSASAGMISGLINTAPPANQNAVSASPTGTGGGAPVIHVHLDGGAVAAAGGPAAAEAMGTRAGAAAAEAYIRRMREAS